jgi:hypothetical protein
MAMRRGGGFFASHKKFNFVDDCYDQIEQKFNDRKAWMCFSSQSLCYEQISAGKMVDEL